MLMKTRFLFLLVLLTMGCISAMAQFQVNGTVVDASDNEPLIGATIMESGSQNGCTTDVDGKFALKVKDGNASLIVSYVGYSTVKIPLKNSHVISVKLNKEDSNLDELVVVGYGVQKKSDLTGAVSSVNAEDIKGLATTDAAAALQGKAAGVQILNTSGAPGEGAKIRIRGYSSNSGNLGPLLIVDGLKVDNIQYLDPSMIKSMEVLKDAASAAIYGAEAGNGVILITTKTGDGGDMKPRVIYSFKAINQRLGKTPELFGAKDWITYKELSGYDMETLCEQNGVNYANPQETNWIKEVFEPSWATQHSVTFQGGNEKGHFFTSINYVDNDGIVKGKKDTYQRLTAQMNADYQLYNWIKVGTTTSIERWHTRSITQQSAYGSMLTPALLLDPLTPVYWDSFDQLTQDMKNKYETDPSHILIAPNGKYYATSKFQNDDNGNPFLQLDRNNNKNSGFTVRGTGFLDLMPFKGFVFTSRFSYRISQSNSHNYTTPYYMNGQAKATDYEISAAANNGYYYQWENFINYNNSFGKNTVGAMIGMSYTQSKTDNVTASAKGNNGEKILNGDYSNFQYLNYVNAAETTTKSFSNLPSLATSLSYFGRILYSYDNRYNIQFNFRADAFDTSKLPKNKRWGKFPSVSAGWTASNESFIRDHINPSAISFLKIRASWGRNGNVNVLSGYPYTAPIAYNQAWYQYGDDPAQHYGSYMTGFANPDLHWETSEQLDFGIDMRFLDSRLTVGLDYYNKNTKDLLISVNTVPEVYHNQTTINAGKINNRGFEAEFGWRDNVGDFNYSVNANFSTLRNRVSELYDGIDRFTTAKGGVDGTNNLVHSAMEKGHPLWFFRAFDYAGVDKETGEGLFRNAAGELVNSSQLTDEDMTDIGWSVPKFNYGITINLEYKGIDFTVFGTGVAGNKIFNILYRADTPMRNSLKYYYDNAWSANNRNASMPSVESVAHDKNFWSSSASMHDGSYFKFKQIQLGYTLPRNITMKAYIKDLRFFVSLDDFFTISKYPGMDPETATTGNNGGMGYDIGSYPTMKKITLGATIGF